MKKNSSMLSKQFDSSSQGHQKLETPSNFKLSQQDYKPTIKKESSYVTPGKTGSNFHQKYGIQDSLQDKLRSDKLKQISEHQYSNELCKVRSECTHLEVKNKMLKGDNEKLEKEIQFLNNKFQIGGRGSSLTQYQNTSPQKDEKLQIIEEENSQLKKDIDSKLQEIQHFKLKFTQQELVDQLYARNAQLEQKIKYLTMDLDQAQTEIKQLQFQLKDKQIVEKELKHLQEILKSKITQTEVLKSEKKETMLDNFKLKKTELILKEKEQIQEETINSLKKSLVMSEKEKLKQLKQQDRVHFEIHENLKKSMDKEIQQKEEELNSIYDNLVSTRQLNYQMNDEIKDLQYENANIKQQEMQAKNEALLWKDRSKSAEKEKEAEIQQERLQRYKSIEEIKDSFNREKESFKGRINYLQKEISRKEDDTSLAEKQLKIQQRKNLLLANSNQALARNLTEAEREKEKLSNSFHKELRDRDQLFNSSLEKERNQHITEVISLKKDNFYLKDLVVDSKSQLEEEQLRQARLQRQNLEEKLKADQYQTKLIEQKRINKFQNELNQQELKKVERSLSDEIEKQKLKNYKQRQLLQEKEDQVLQEKKQKLRMAQGIDELERIKMVQSQEIEKLSDRVARTERLKDIELRQNSEAAQSHIDFLNRSLDKQKQHFEDKVDNLNYRCRLKGEEVEYLRQSNKKIYQNRFYD